MHDKPTLRQHMRSRLRAMEESARRSAASHIAGHILHRCDQSDASFCISLFGGLKNEPDFLPLVLPEIVAAASCAAFFQIEGNELRPRQVRSMDDLQRGQMNVWEPKDQWRSSNTHSLQTSTSKL
jgi:5-formyltetrahydrofolate cyclo-ligase